MPMIIMDNLPPGPWIEDLKTYKEPRYKFEVYGYKCKLVRQRMGYWTGYVTLPESHPDYNTDDEELDIKVHGNITYNNGYGTFGFDTCHYDDIVPGWIKYGLNSRATFKDYKYVEKEVIEMARQFKERE